MDSAYHQRVKAMLQKLARERDMGVGAGVNMGGVLMGAGPKGTKKLAPRQWVFSKEGNFRSWNPELGMYEEKLRKIGEEYIAMPKGLRAKKRAEASKKYREAVKLGERTVKPRKIKPTPTSEQMKIMELVKKPRLTKAEKEYLSSLGLTRKGRKKKVATEKQLEVLKRGRKIGAQRREARKAFPIALETPLPEDNDIKETIKEKIDEGKTVEVAVQETAIEKAQENGTSPQVELAKAADVAPEAAAEIAQEQLTASGFYGRRKRRYF